MRIPPPVYALAAAGLMWFLARHYPLMTTDRGWPFFAGLLILAIGIGVDFYAANQFRLARTTINPIHPEASTQLVTDGLYAHSRNPMYVGLLIALLGIALFLRALSPLLVLPLFVVVVTAQQILPEEKALHRNFGDEFVRYKQTVPRWLW